MFVFIAGILLREWLNDGDNLPVLKISTLFHDIGKPLVRAETSSGKITFYRGVSFDGP